MGVVSGIIVLSRFCTDQGRFPAAAANMISPLIVYEWFMAFAVEATFLGILLFGRRLGSPLLSSSTAV
jgi:cytochrome bd ubiquinol oxidase subunit I